MAVSPTTDEHLDDGTGEDQSVDLGSGNNSSDEDSGSNTAASPAADNLDDNKPKDMVSAVRAALDSGKEQSSGSEQSEGEGTTVKKPEGQAAEKPAGAEEEGSKELSEQELKTLKPRTRQRLQYLTRYNAELKAEMDKFKELGDVAAVKTEAEGYRTILRMATEANLSREDVNTGFNLMSLFVNDPEKAYEQFTPLYRQLCSRIGVILPEDLHKKVETGEIAETHAREIARLRARDGLTAEQRETQRLRNEEAETQRIADADVKLKADVGEAITKWESRQKGLDPNYSLKQARVIEAVELEIMRANQAGKSINSVEEAIKMADRVKLKVDAELKRFVPRKTSITPIRGDGANPGSKPVPTSSREAILQALQS